MERKVIFLCSLLLTVENILQVEGGVTPSMGMAIRHEPRQYYYTYREEKQQQIQKPQKKQQEMVMMAKECNGEENFKTDVSVVSFIIGMLSSVAGITSLIKLTGTPGVIVSIIDETLGVISLSLDALTTFPDKFDKAKWKVQSVLGMDVVDEFLSGYGCGETEGETLRSHLKWK